MCFYCSLLFLMCTLVVHRYFFIVLRWCLSLPPCTLVTHRLLLIVLCCCSLGLVVFYYCLLGLLDCAMLMPPCYALFVFIGSSLLCSIMFIGTSLLCLVGACQCVLVMLHWCSSTCPCYVLLVFVDASMLCFIVVHWHLLVTFPDLRGLMYFSTYRVHCCSLVLPCCTQCCCSLVLSLVYFSNHICSLSFLTSTSPQHFCVKEKKF